MGNPTISIEVCIPIAGDLLNCNSIRAYGNLLGAKMLHKDSYSRLSESYAKVIKLLKRMDINMWISYREIYY
jgi:effector-binding domain-containing protein